MSRRWGGILGLILTIIFAGLALYRLDLGMVVATLAAANYFLLPIAALFTLVGYIFRTARWRFILAPAKDISVPRLFPVLVIGFAANNLLPARLGEFVRAYLLGSKEKISKSLSFATIVVERILDGLTLIAILALVSLFVALPGWSQQLGVIATFVFLIALLGLLLLLYRQEGMLALFQRLTSLLPNGLARRLQGMAVSFVEGIGALRQRSLFLPLFLLSLGVWLLEAGSYVVITWSLPLPLSLAERFWAALLVMTLANLGILIPSSPGYVGTFHFFAMTGLLAFGVSRELALSYAVLAHATQYLLITGLGVTFIWQENLSLTGLQAQVGEET